MDLYRGLNLYQLLEKEYPPNFDLGNYLGLISFEAGQSRTIPASTTFENAIPPYSLLNTIYLCKNDRVFEFGYTEFKDAESLRQ
ncbi:2751_t:CDS:2 [Paraglomus occultum]|uniref:2751_t:CDS:1 n=1 Tax=Paraglomus occultum TaxID=144539 RepID=A0A9N8Z1X2_9GLOM|nr:2751_t:CDS:2 [Paraglomus occultum]